MAMNLLSFISISVTVNVSIKFRKNEIQFWKITLDKKLDGWTDGWKVIMNGPKIQI